MCASNSVYLQVEGEVVDFNSFTSCEVVGAIVAVLQQHLFICVSDG